MKDVLSDFLYNKEIAREIYYVEYNSEKLEYFFKNLKEQYFLKALNSSAIFQELYHHRAGEVLGKGIIVAYEFGGMKEVRKIMKEITEKSIEIIVNSEDINSPISKDIKEKNKKDFQEMLEMMKEEVGNIEKMLNEWE